MIPPIRVLPTRLRDCRLERPFSILERAFRFLKVRFPGLKMNHDHLRAAFALVNLYRHPERLAHWAGPEPGTNKPQPLVWDAKPARHHLPAVKTQARSENP